MLESFWFPIVSWLFLLSALWISGATAGASLHENNFLLKGETRYIGTPEYKKHGAASIKLQDHGDPSPPISFRNIWVREL